MGHPADDLDHPQSRRHVAYAILTPVTVYFFVTSRRARSTSRDYLSRVFDREPSLGEIYRHCFTYAASNMDRVLFLSNRIAGYEIDVSGLDLLKRLIAEGGEAVSCSAPISAISMRCAS